MNNVSPVIDYSSYDFLDFGCSTGDSLRYAQEHLGGGRGLGIDRSTGKVALAQQEGWECHSADLLNLDAPDNCVRFVVIRHLLEHLRSKEQAQAVIQHAARVAREFVFIAGPWFDADEYLHALQLKLFWSDWTGHRLHLNIEMLSQILSSLGLVDHEMFGCTIIPDTAHGAVLPIDAPPDIHGYRLEHGFRPELSFSRPVFEEIICYLQVNKDNSGLPPFFKSPALVPLESLCDSEHPFGAPYSKDDIIKDQIRHTKWLRKLIYDQQVALQAKAYSPAEH